MKKEKFSRREFLKVSAHALVSVGLGGLGTFKYSTTYEPNWLDVEQVVLKLPRLPKDFAGFRVVQFSDTHVDEWMTQDRLHAVIETVNAQNPDLIVFTGDFVTEMPAVHATMLVDELSQLDAPEGVYAVMGNHDHWTDVAVMRKILVESGVIELKNSVAAIARGPQQIYLCGVDDVWEEQHDLDAVINDLPDDVEVCAILLCHEPDFVDMVADTGRFDLQLSGHSHGGQVVLPFVGPPILPNLGEKYPAGLYVVGDMWQYTNRGVGMGSPRVRFNCRPEITVFEFS